MTDITSTSVFAWNDKFLNTSNLHSAAHDNSFYDTTFKMSNLITLEAFQWLVCVFKN